MSKQNSIKLNWIMIPTFLLTSVNTLFAWTLADEHLKSQIVFGFWQVILMAMNERILIISLTYLAFIILIFGFLALVSHLSLSLKSYKAVILWTMIELIAFTLVKSVLIIITSPQAILIRLICVLLMVGLGAIFTIVLLNKSKTASLKTWAVITQNIVQYQNAYGFILIVMEFIVCVGIAFAGILFSGLPLLNWISLYIPLRG